jgi:hypothetical protein
VTTKQRNAINRTFGRSEEHEQDFIACQKASDFRLSAGCITYRYPKMAQQSSRKS